MAMSVSKVDICNMALDFLGSETIVSLSDDTKSARYCNRNYPLIRDEVLRTYYWKFSIFRSDLLLLASTPVSGYSKEFQLPVDFIRLIGLTDDSIDYSLEGDNKLLTDSDTVSIIYIARITDTSKYDPQFVSVLAARLSMQLALPLTSSKEYFRIALSEFERTSLEAMNSDSVENPDTNLSAEDWLNART